MKLIKSGFPLQVLLSILLFIFSGLGTADIYRYQDENGRWHFSDTRPDDQEVDIISTHEKKEKQPNELDEDALDIREALFDRFKPNTPVEEATLSVVTINAHMGTGSGFFVSEHCHIVTNRHVVRPSETEAWQNQKEILETRDKEISDSVLSVKAEEERLGRYKRSLDKRRRYINGLSPGPTKAQEEIEYDQYVKIYNEDMEKLASSTRMLEQLKREHRSQTSEFSLDSSLSAVARSFKVILKDGSEKRAQLVHLSKELDLALLKIDKCRSPFLEIDLEYQTIQGMKVYSIGSPLGQRDHLTSGVITNVRDDAITIDAQILPGNSGGPLINEAGKFIGVNSQKLSVNNPNSQGFGLAIPARFVKKNLWSYIEQ